MHSFMHAKTGKLNEPILKMLAKYQLEQIQTLQTYQEFPIRKYKRKYRNGSVIVFVVVESTKTFLT